MNHLAPIALFVYNRPRHTKETLVHLSKNTLADQSVLYVFADGPKPKSDKNELDKIEEVRKILREKKWCKEIQIIEESENMGIYKSMVPHITEIVNRYGRIIVLEDDILSSNNFLVYANKALEKYQNIDKVMNVSGYAFPIKGTPPSTYFLNSGSGWGWATWSRSWNQFIGDSQYLIDELENRNLVHKLNFNGSADYFGLLKAHHYGTLTAWDVCWHATIVLKRGLTLFPSKSFTRNIGMDGSGTHFKKNIQTEFIKVEPVIDDFIIDDDFLTNEISVSDYAEKKLESYFRKLNNKNFFNIALNKIKSTLISLSYKTKTFLT